MDKKQYQEAKRLLFEIDPSEKENFEENLDALTGPPGKDGKDGKDGRDGLNGLDGINGKDGIDGKDGIQGPEGTPGERGEDGTSVKLKEVLEELRPEIVKRLPTGGGNMNRNIAVDGNSSVLSRYTDINLKSGTGITLGYVSNNTSKFTDITITSSASGGGVASVTASSPLNSSGGSTPNISLTGIVPVANGGTGVSSITSGRIMYGNGTSPIGQDPNLTWSSTTGLLILKGISSQYIAGAVGEEVYGLGASDSSTNTTDNQNTIIGAGANTNRVATINQYSTIIGSGANSSGGRSLVIGYQATTSAFDTTVIGNQAVCLQPTGIAIGSGANNSSTGNGGVIIGGGQLASGAILSIVNGVASHQNAGCLGWGSSSSQQGELSWGQRNAVSLAPSFIMAGCSNSQFTGLNTWRVNTTFIDSTIATGKSRAEFSVYDQGNASTQNERPYMRADALGTGVQSQMYGAFYPPTDAGALQTASAMRAGTGAPSNSNGADGDYYFRSDGGVATHIYFRSGGTWSGII